MSNECTHGQLARSCELCEKDARIAELEKLADRSERAYRDRAAPLIAAVAEQRERIERLEKALQEIANEAGSHTVSLAIPPQPGAGHVYVYALAMRALANSLMVFESGEKR